MKYNIQLDNLTTYNINIDLLEQIALELTDQQIELIVCYNDYIQQLNKQYRNIDKATDVLSFPYEKMPFAPLGSIVISVDFAEQYSKKFLHSFDNEMALLFIHGLLHILGYDHEVDDGEHRDMEEQIISKFDLPKSLIVRNS